MSPRWAPAIEQVMATISNDSRFLGLDLRTLRQALVRPWQGIENGRLMGWLSPGVPVRLWDSDGSHADWLSGTPPQRLPAVKVARFVALALPEPCHLHRQFQLPHLAPDALAQAVALEVRSASPFVADDLVWGYGVSAVSVQGVVIDAVLASRKQVDAYIQTQAQLSRWDQALVPEVWAVVGAADKPFPVVIQGFGEERRARYRAAWRYVGLAFAALALAIGVAMALTPTVQLWRRSLEAVASYTGLQQRTQALVREREAFVKSTERLKGLSEILERRVDVLQVMDFLTKTLPDDTSIQQLQVNGKKISINGLTSNVATLMTQLSAQPGLRDVKAPTGTTRQAGAQKENFIIEFEWDPKAVKTETATATVPANQASSPAVPLPATTSSAPLPVASAAPPSAPIAAVSAVAKPPPPPVPAVAPLSPAAKSPFSIGGGSSSPADKVKP